MKFTSILFLRVSFFLTVSIKNMQIQFSLISVIKVVIAEITSQLFEMSKISLISKY